MIRKKTRVLERKYGFTLIEASAAVTITVLVLGMAVGGFMYSLKNTNETDVQSELDIDVQLSMESLKKDLRLSSLDKIFYYPQGPGPYTAISFPLAEDTDGDGLFELDADGKIIWDKTVIYHVWPSSPNELRVTTFNNRDNTLTDAQRQEQLNSVVETGSGSSTYNGANASTHAIFRNLLDWTIQPQKGVFDAYAPTMKREATSLGFALLGNGTHTFQFKVAGKNAAASGYKIGIDQLFVSPSYSEREAEAQLPASAQSGATPVAQYIANGSWKGNYQLYFPATAVGNSFTLKMNNDQWTETNFGALGYQADDTEVDFDDTMSPKDFVVQLQGNDTTWEAALQTDSTGTSVSNSVLKGNWITVHVNGSELLTNGNWISSSGRRCKLTFQASDTGPLQVEAAYIAKSAKTTESTPFAYTGSWVPATFGGNSSSFVMLAGQSETSDWIDMEINRTNNYLVLYKIKDEADKCYPMSWPENRTTSPECYINSSGTYTNCLFGLASITASYAANGTYTSQIFDTRLSSPTYGDVSWNADVPAGTVLTTKVRTGNQPDLSDASDWSTISPSSVNPRSVSAAYKRYVQFQAQMESSSDGLYTPKLKDITIDWTGETQLVNVSGIMTKGPDYGVMEVLVDGMPLQSALSVDLRIYKDIFSINNATKRITSSLVADIRPRNTGK